MIETTRRFSAFPSSVLIWPTQQWRLADPTYRPTLRVAPSHESTHATICFPMDYCFCLLRFILSFSADLLFLQYSFTCYLLFTIRFCSVLNTKLGYKSSLENHKWLQQQRTQLFWSHDLMTIFFHLSKLFLLRLIHFKNWQQLPVIIISSLGLAKSLYKK